MKTILVGAAGHQGLQYLRSLGTDVEFVALVDKQPMRVHRRHRLLPWFETLSEALEEVNAECALIAVPHHLHLPISVEALSSGLHVVKEKPLSATLEERDTLLAAAGVSNRSLLTIAQRAYRRTFRAAIDQLKLIGEPYSFTYHYHANRQSATTGWRANPSMAGGGVLLDMGYHVLDMLDRLFGLPESGHATLSYCFPQLERKRLEDVANGLLRYRSGLSGAVVISRHSRAKEEQLEIRGTKGTIMASPTVFKRYSFDGSLVRSILDTRTESTVARNMLLHYISNLRDSEFCRANVSRHSRIVEVLELLYRTSEAVQPKPKHGAA